LYTKITDSCEERAEIDSIFSLEKIF